MKWQRRTVSSVGRLSGAGLVALWLGLACSQGESWQRSSQDQCPATCADCSQDIACGGAKPYCPVGTTCEATSYAGAPAACRPNYFPSIPPTKLLDGFQASEFLLTRDPTAPSQFTFQVPEKARFVSCALFIAEPLFESVSAASFEQAGTMVNSSACTAAHRVFRVNGGNADSRPPALRLDELSRAGSSCDTSNGSPIADDPRYPVVETLSLGCWANGDDGVVGASTLLSIAPSELPTSASLPLDSCDQAMTQTDGAFCVMQDLPGACDGADTCVSGAVPDIVTPACAACGAAGDAQTSDAGLATEVCAGKPKGTACRAKPSAAVGRCLAGGCVDQQVTLERPLVVSDCAQEGDSNWLNCFPSPIGTIGTCFDHLCRVRCHDDADCAFSQRFRASNASGLPTPHEHCQRAALAPGYLGVCEQAP